MSIRRCSVACSGALAMLLVAAAAPCAAQENNSLAVGVNVSTRIAPDARVDATDSIGIKWRLGHGETGWGWTWGLGWYTTHVTRDIGGRETELGKLRIRPILAGYGYTHAIGDRVTVGADLLAGVAFCSLTITPEADDALHGTGARSIRTNTSVTPVIKPQIGMWYDLGRRFGVGADLGYVMARTRITIDSSIGRDASRVRADSFILSGGIVYRIF